MKKFNRSKHKTMGTMPDELRKLVGTNDMSVATDEFNQYMLKFPKKHW